MSRGVKRNLAGSPLDAERVVRLEIVADVGFEIRPGDTLSFKVISPSKFIQRYLGRGEGQDAAQGGEAGAFKNQEEMVEFLDGILKIGIGNIS